MAQDQVTQEEMRNRRRAGSDPTRLRMWELFQQRPEWTAKEMADELGVEANRLYYHLRIFEEVGAIRVVGTKAPGRMVERVYAPVPEWDYVTWDATQPGEVAIHLAAILDAAKVGAEDALYERARRIAAGEEELFVSYAGPAISGMRRQDIVEFRDRLLALDKEFRDRRDQRKDEDGNLPPDTRRLKYAYVIYEEPPPKWMTDETKRGTEVSK